MHLQAFCPQTDLIQQRLDVFDPAFGSDITFQVMTISSKSTCHHDGVGSLFKGFEDMQGVQLAGTR